MTIHRVPKTCGYTVIQNEILQDPTLTWECRGAIAYLLSKPDYWNVSVSDLIAQSRTQGAKIAKRIIRELSDAGYLIRSRTQDKQGRWEWQSDLFESKDLARTWTQSHSTETMMPLRCDGNGAMVRDRWCDDAKSTQTVAAQGLQAETQSHSTETMMPLRIDGKRIDRKGIDIINTEVQSTESISTKDLDLKKESKKKKIASQEFGGHFSEGSEKCHSHSEPQIFSLEIDPEAELSTNTHGVDPANSSLGENEDLDPVQIELATEPESAPPPTPSPCDEVEPKARKGRAKTPKKPKPGSFESFLQRMRYREEFLKFLAWYEARAASVGSVIGSKAKAAERWIQCVDEPDLLNEFREGTKFWFAQNKGFFCLPHAERFIYGGTKYPVPLWREALELQRRPSEPVEAFIAPEEEEQAKTEVEIVIPKTPAQVAEEVKELRRLIGLEMLRHREAPNKPYGEDYWFTPVMPYPWRVYFKVPNNGLVSDFGETGNIEGLTNWLLYLRGEDFPLKGKIYDGWEFLDYTEYAREAFLEIYDRSRRAS